MDTFLDSLERLQEQKKQGLLSVGEYEDEIRLLKMLFPTRSEAELEERKKKGVPAEGEGVSEAKRLKNEVPLEEEEALRRRAEAILDKALEKAGRPEVKRPAEPSGAASWIKTAKDEATSPPEAPKRPTNDLSKKPEEDGKHEESEFLDLSEPFESKKKARQKPEKLEEYSLVDAFEEAKRRKEEGRRERERLEGEAKREQEHREKEQHQEKEQTLSLDEKKQEIEFHYYLEKLAKASSDYLFHKDKEAAFFHAYQLLKSKPILVERSTDGWSKTFRSVASPRLFLGIVLAVFLPFLLAYPYHYFYQQVFRQSMPEVLNWGLHVSCVYMVLVGALKHRIWRLLFRFELTLALYSIAALLYIDVTHHELIYTRDSQLGAMSNLWVFLGAITAACVVSSLASWPSRLSRGRLLFTTLGFLAIAAGIAAVFLFGLPQIGFRPYQDFPAHMTQAGAAFFAVAIVVALYASNDRIVVFFGLMGMALAVYLPQREMFGNLALWKNLLMQADVFQTYVETFARNATAGLFGGMLLGWLIKGYSHAHEVEAFSSEIWALREERAYTLQAEKAAQAAKAQNLSKDTKAPAHAASTAHAAPTKTGEKRT